MSVIEASYGPNSVAEQLDRAKLPSSSFDFARLKAILSSELQSEAFDPHFAPTIGSTMNMVSHFREHDLELKIGSVLIAGNQTAGAGVTPGSVWNSTVEDAAFTLALPQYPPEKRNYHSLISLAVCAGIIDGLVAASGEPTLPLAVKLGNDVYVNERERFSKLAGVWITGPCEPRGSDRMLEKGFAQPKDLTLYGIGINLTNSMVKDELGGASIQDLIGRRIAVEDAIGHTLVAIFRNFELLARHPEVFSRHMVSRLATGATGGPRYMELEYEDGSRTIVSPQDITDGGLTCFDPQIQKSCTIPIYDIVRAFPYWGTLNRQLLKK